MEKIKNLIPEKISVLGHNVVVTDKLFNDIIAIINLQVTTINNMIDVLNTINLHLDTADAHTQQLQNSIQALAEALNVYTEE